MLEILPLRGNVNTRLRKLDEGKYDAMGSPRPVSSAAS